MRRMTFILVLLLWSETAIAALTPSALATADVTLPPNAHFPLTLTAPDVNGISRRMDEIIAGRPAFVLFADYTCTNLCGPALVLLSSALESSGMTPDSYGLIVIGLDPKDSPEDGRRMLMAQVPEKLRQNTVLLLPDSATLATAAKAAGFHYVYDKSVDQFAHPELVYAVASDGRILRLLSPFALTTSDMKRALFASEPNSSLYDRLRLICYRFGMLSGPYDALIGASLKIAAVVTLFAALGAFFLMQRRNRAVP